MGTRTQACTKALTSPANLASFAAKTDHTLPMSPSQAGSQGKAGRETGCVREGRRTRLGLLGSWSSARAQDRPGLLSLHLWTQLQIQASPPCDLG